MTNLVKSLVSKKKRRFNQDGFDLDLTYITPAVIAMGFPADKMEGLYRNNIVDVIKFMDSRHEGQYKVYNLCSERCYDAARFHGRVAHYPFDDHNAPPVDMMHAFCVDVHRWLSEHEGNVAAVHCKAGKGRTGVMICAYLLHCGMWKTADEALRFYGAARTFNAKGVTIPSQARYVKYYEDLLKSCGSDRNGSITYEKRPLLLTKAVMRTIPRFSKEVISCCPVMEVSMNRIKVYSSQKSQSDLFIKDAPNTGSLNSEGVESMSISLHRPLPVCGDVKLEFHHKQSMSKEKMFHFWINTAFIPLINPAGKPNTDESTRRVLVLTKFEIDKAHKDKNHKVFDKQFAIELHFADPIPGYERSSFDASRASETLEADDDTEDSFGNDIGDEEEEDF